MNFHLNYTPPKSDFEINHDQKIFLIGSCFSDNIGKLLSEHKFKTLSNPDGILFNPLSIYTSLKNTLNQTTANKNLLLQYQHSFYSYLHHSSIHASEKKELIEKINSGTQTAFSFLSTTDVLIITFGTAFYYHHIQLKQTVANCHKQPSNYFEKKLLTVQEIVTLYSDLIKALHATNPNLKIIFTVSPVKYLKDGIVENNISKSTLLLSVHQLAAQLKNCFYFPAYELVNDDLRDYRFYKEDLAHPNEQAIGYVWQKFSSIFFSEKTLEINQEIEKLNSALSHRVMNEQNLEYQKLQHFITAQKEKIKALASNIEV